MTNRVILGVMMIVCLRVTYRFVLRRVEVETTCVMKEEGGFSLDYSTMLVSTQLSWW